MRKSVDKMYVCVCVKTVMYGTKKKAREREEVEEMY
jgi:hypothetical protein